MLHKLSLSVAIVAASFSYSLAADPVYQDKDVVPIDSGRFDWSGKYFGVQIGHGQGDGSHTIITDGLGFLNAPFGPDDIDGAFGGVNAGYNVQNGDIVYGVNFEINASDITGVFSNDPFVDDRYETKIDWFGSATLRAGMVLPSSPRTQVYVAGGVAVAKINATNGDEDRVGGVLVFDCSGTGCAEGNETAFGYTVGAGLAHAGQMWGREVIWSLDYKYYDFGDVRFDTTTQPGGLPHSFDVTANFHAITAGVAFKF